MITRPTQPGPSLRPAAAIDRASAAHRNGNVLVARQLLQERIARNPQDADALAKLAEIALAQKSVEEATVLLQRAVSVDPSPHRRVALIVHLQRSGEPAMALAEIECLPRSVRRQSRIKEVEATVLSSLGRDERAIRLRKEIVRERPTEPKLWCTLANSLTTVGRLDEAVAALVRATKQAPKSGEPWWHLSNLKSYKFSPAEIALMKQALMQASSDDDRLHIHFALGKAFEDARAFEESFRHYAAANAIGASRFGENQTITAQIDQSVALLTPEFFERNKGAGCNEAGPIFVVGVHRSGSTLIEQILASHSMIEGIAELPVIANVCGRLEREMRMPAPRAIASLPPSAFSEIGEEILEAFRPFRRTERPYFVDKKPGNWVCLGLVRVALPNARIIDARRHPMACGFSNFKQHYPKGVGFASRLRTIGTFYQDYWRFMNHFDRVQPGVVHRVVNEHLVSDPEHEIRTMLGYLGLPFEASCLEFHRNQRAVRTPSAEQVRQPINSKGVEQWKNYEPWLGELKEALGPALHHWND